MNGCLVFLLLIYGFFYVLRLGLKPTLAKGYWQAVSRCLRQRDYLLRELKADSELERWLRDRLLAQIRSGRLKAEDLEFFERNYVESEQLSSDGLRLLWSYVFHLGFVLLVPTLFRALIVRKVWFDRFDAAEIMIAVGVAGLGLWILHKEWPRAVLIRKESFQEFATAYWGEGPSGRFARRIEELREAALHEGSDEASERGRYLREWHLAEIAKFRTRLAWFENALGPLELFSSCVFAVLLLGLPLINHFGALL